MTFTPCDAMARCLSVCHKSEFYQNRWADLACFWRGGMCDEEVLVSLKNKSTIHPSGTLPQTLDLENFATASQSSKCVVNLVQQRLTLSAIHWTVVDGTKLTILVLATVHSQFVTLNVYCVCGMMYVRLHVMQIYLRQPMVVLAVQRNMWACCRTWCMS